MNRTTMAPTPETLPMPWFILGLFGPLSVFVITVVTITIYRKCAATRHDRLIVDERSVYRHVMELPV